MASQTKTVLARPGMSGPSDWYSFALTTAQATTIDLAMLFGTATVVFFGGTGLRLPRADATAGSDGILNVPPRRDLHRQPHRF